MVSRMQPERRPVYKALHRPLTVCGVDRRLFFMALLMGAVYAVLIDPAGLVELPDAGSLAGSRIQFQLLKSEFGATRKSKHTARSVPGCFVQHGHSPKGREEERHLLHMKRTTWPAEMPAGVVSLTQ